MRKLLTICGILLTLTASAQWQQTAAKVRYVNGIGIPTKDTAAGVSADSSQILIRPADSSLYMKYKRTWMRVGGGGGSIAGSGVSGRVAFFNGTSSITSSSNLVWDNTNGRLGVDVASPSENLEVYQGALLSTPINFISYLGFGARSSYGWDIGRADTSGTNAPKGGFYFRTINSSVAKFAVDTSGSVFVNSTNNSTSQNYNSLQLYRKSSTANAGNGITLGLNNDLNQSAEYGYVGSIIENSLSGSQSGSLTFAPVSNGIRTERVRITSGGRVNIGGSFTSTNNTLQVTGNAAIGYTTAAPTNGLIVSGNTGIGDASAANRLTVYQDVNGDARISLTNPNTGTSARSFMYTLTTGNRYVGFIQYGVNATGTTVGLTNASLSQIQAGGDNSAFLIEQGSTTAPIVLATNSVERLRVKSDGEVLVGNTDNGAYNLQCNGTGVWGAGAYVNGSDSSLKDSVIDLNNTLALIMKMKPKTYKYRPFYNKSNIRQVGFIAQELEQVLKDEAYKDGIVISGGKYKGVAYEAIIPLLVKSIQEQQSQIDTLKSQIDELKKLITNGIAKQ